MNLWRPIIDPTRTFIGCSILAVTLLSAATTWAYKTIHKITDIAIIPLRHGVNEIDDLAGDGRKGIIVDAWRENMNAHGYTVYSVLLPRPGTVDDWNLVDFETHRKHANGGTQVDSLYAQPFEDERTLDSVRFVKAKLDGVRATLAISARRDMSNAESYGDKLPVIFEIYRLGRNEEGIPGWPLEYFDLIERFRAKNEYCNSDLALTRELNPPLPADYQGYDDEDGCGN